MMGARDDIHALTEDWGIDLEGEVVALVGDVPMGATPRQAAPQERLLALVNDIYGAASDSDARQSAFATP